MTKIELYKCDVFDSLKELTDLSRETAGAGYSLAPTKTGGFVLYFLNLSMEYKGDNILDVLEQGIKFIKSKRELKDKPINIKYILKE